MAIGLDRQWRRGEVVETLWRRCGFGISLGSGLVRCTASRSGVAGSGLASGLALTGYWPPARIIGRYALSTVGLVGLVGLVGPTRLGGRIPRLRRRRRRSSRRPDLEAPIVLLETTDRRVGRRLPTAYKAQKNGAPIRDAVMSAEPIASTYECRSPRPFDRPPWRRS